jgi:hypothetical protein
LSAIAETMRPSRPRASCTITSMTLQAVGPHAQRRLEQIVHRHARLAQFAVVALTERRTWTAVLHMRGRQRVWFSLLVRAVARMAF